MAFHNSAVPNYKAFVRESHFYDGDETKCDFVPVVVYGCVSRPGQSIGWHVLTERGVSWWGVPTHMLSMKPNVESRQLDHLVLWDCFSLQFDVTKYDLLDRVECKLLNGSVCAGSVLFTLDWTGGWAEMPEEHKSGHVIALDEGNIAVLPNNRCIFREPSFVTKPFDLTRERPDYRTNTRRWSTEGLIGTPPVEEAYADPNSERCPESADGKHHWKARGAIGGEFVACISCGKRL